MIEMQIAAPGKEDDSGINAPRPSFAATVTTIAHAILRFLICSTPPPLQTAAHGVELNENTSRNKTKKNDKTSTVESDKSSPYRSAAATTVVGCNATAGH